MPTSAEISPATDVSPEPPTAAIRLVTMVVVFAAVYALAVILVPFLLALVLAIAMAPIAHRIERAGLGRTLASLICLVLVAVVLTAILGLIGYQVNAIVRDGNKYIDRLGDFSARLVRSTGGENLLESLTADEPPMPASSDAGDALVANAKAAILHNARSIGLWTVTGLGGLIGVFGHAILFLAFFFYMLQGRSEWMDRLHRAALGLRMRPRSREFAKVGDELKTYLGTLAVVSSVYFVVISVALWFIGVPQPLLWGILTAILELIPFFGQVLAGTLPAIAALGAGGGTWQPIAVIALFVTLEMVEGYLVAPLLYGQSVEIEPVTVLLGVLFFGWLLGPAGLALAMPLMILLRGVLVMTPDTPTLDALADTKQS